MALNKYIWELKDSKIDFAVSWRIIKNVEGTPAGIQRNVIYLYMKST